MGTIGHLSPQGSVALGIIVGLISTSVQSLGLTLQRKSHILEDEKDPSDPRRPPHRRRRWQLGMLMFIVSNLAGSSIQITTLPLPVLSTLQASGLVFNSLCATLILGEPFTRWSLGGTILVSIGAVLIAIFGAIGEPAHNLDQLLELLGRRQFIIWMIWQAILVAAIIAGAKSIKYLNPWSSNSPRMRLFRGMAYGGVSGVLSAHSLLVAKSAVELLVRTIVDRHNEFNRWQSWIILLGLLALALTQLYYLHRGLKLCSTSILYPFVFCVYNIIAILDGLIYFHQTSQLSLLDALLIALGTVILLIGVLALSWRLNNDPTTRPPVSQNPLTPGMGFVSDTSDSETENAVTSPLLDPENAQTTANGKESPLFPPPDHRRTNHHAHFFPQSPDLHIPRTRTNRPLSESAEIWEELEDSPLPPSTPLYSPHTRRRSSVHARSASRPTNITPSSAPHTPTPNRTNNDENDADHGDPNESTSLLHTNTGRSYRAARSRRSTTLAGGERRRRSVGSQSQEAVGGWWKMKWWRGGKDPSSSASSRDNGGGEGA